MHINIHFDTPSFYCRMAFDNLYFERDESFPLAGFAVRAVCLGGFLFHFSLIHNFLIYLPFFIVIFRISRKYLLTIGVVQALFVSFLYQVVAIEKADLIKLAGNNYISAFGI